MDSKYTEYSVIIQWSEEDKLYIASLPEFPICRTHGSSYEEAMQQAEEVLELLIEAYEEWQRPVPPPHVLTSSAIEQ
ncbi:MAG: type II toxin-antitoxin system HicB family antitoxin, partial [Ktedonobacteraceae bacterium]